MKEKSVNVKKHGVKYSISLILLFKWNIAKASCRDISLVYFPQLLAIFGLHLHVFLAEYMFSPHVIGVLGVFLGVALVEGVGVCTKEVFCVVLVLIVVYLFN